MQDLNRRRFLQTTLATLGTGTLPLSATPDTPFSKKGLGLASKNPIWAKLVKELDPNWIYTWGSERPKTTPKDTEFVPMIWGYWGQKEAIRKAAAEAKTRGTKELLGFNEPEKKSQSNMSIETVLKHWPKLMETGLRLGSPGCVHPDGEWMKAFMSAAKRKDLRVDFVCVHSYGNANSKTFLKRMERVHRLFKKPIWITEFAVGDWDAKSVEQNRYKPDKVLKFMEEVFPALDKLDYVERHAWFPSLQSNRHLGNSALFKKDGELTPLGEFYRDYR